MITLQLLTTCMVLDYLHVELRARKMFLAILKLSTGKLCRAKISSTFLDDLVLKTSIFIISSISMSHSDNTCPQSGSDTSHLTDIDKAPRPSISNDDWIQSCDICQLNQLFSNSEAATLSSRTAQSTRLHKTLKQSSLRYNIFKNEKGENAAK